MIRITKSDQLSTAIDKVVAQAQKAHKAGKDIIFFEEGNTLGVGKSQWALDVAKQYENWHADNQRKLIQDTIKLEELEKQKEQKEGEEK